MMLCVFAFASCKERIKKHKTVKTVKVKVFKHKSVKVDNIPDNDYDFIYAIFDNLGNCDYYVSPTQVTNYRTISWTSATVGKLPQELQDKSKLEELEEEEVGLDELSEEMQADIEADPNAVVSEEEDAEVDSESESESDGNSDSDGGSGGDGGGGDGGGGGGD